MMHMPFGPCFAYTTNGFVTNALAAREIVLLGLMHVHHQG